MKKILLIAMSITMVTAFAFGQESTTKSTNKSQTSTEKSAAQDKTSTNTNQSGTGTGASQSGTGTGSQSATQPRTGTQPMESERGKDLTFVNEAASSSLMEIQLGKLAQQKATSQAVKDLARTIERDHTDANNKLKTAMQKLGVPVPSNMIEKHQDHVEDLSEKTGAEFDKAYVDMMVKHHKEDVDKFEKASEELQDASLKQWASSTLPVLKKHVAEAEKLQEQVK